MEITTEEELLTLPKVIERDLFDLIDLGQLAIRAPNEFKGSYICLLVRVSTKHSMHFSLLKSNRVLGLHLVCFVVASQTELEPAAYLLGCGCMLLYLLPHSFLKN